MHMNPIQRNMTIKEKMQRLRNEPFLTNTHKEA
jgi:hypothetical protein